MTTTTSTTPSSINKLLRAKKLREEVDQVYWAYIQSRPYRLTATADTTIPGYRVTTNYAPPPAELALAFGDFVHNLRSALDHLARELVVAGGGVPIDGVRGTAFPVAQTPSSFEVRAQNGGGPTASDLALLESVQPYNSTSPVDHPLTRLNELDNIDKHRHINLFALAATAEVTFRSVSQNEPTTEKTPRYIINPTAGDILSIPVKEPLIKGEVAVEGMHNSIVVLHEPSLYGQPMELVCNELYDFVVTQVFGLWN